MSELKPCPLPTFHVIDHTTGKEADEYEIALHEPWASHLCYCDMEGWAIEQDGTLILVDECGQFAYPPKPERFEVVFDDSRAQPANEPLTLEQLKQMDGEPVWVKYRFNPGFGKAIYIKCVCMIVNCKTEMLNGTQKSIYMQNTAIYEAYAHKPGGEQE